MKQKKKQIIIEYCYTIVALVAFVLLKLYATDSIAKANHSIAMLLAGDKGYTDTGNMITAGYEGILRGICNLYLKFFHNQIGVLGYLEVAMQVITIYLLVQFSKMLIGRIGGMVTLVLGVVICIPTAPLEYFIILILAIYMFLFAKFHTLYFTNSASKATTMICAVLFGVISAVHAYIAPYGIYISFVFIIAGVIIVDNFRFVQLFVTLASYVVCNYVTQGYSVSSYEDWVVSNWSDIVNSFVSNNLVELCVILVVIALLGIGACFAGDKKFTVFTVVLALGQVVNCIYHNFTLQGMMCTILFLMIMVSNLVHNMVVWYETSSKYNKSDKIEANLKRKQASEEVKELETVKEPEIVEELEEVKEPEIVEELEEVKEPEIVEDLEIMEESEILKELETVKEPEEVKESEIVEEPEEVEDKVIQYIENPLPVPKKHVPTTMDYAVDLTPETCDFDLDDYDSMDGFDV